MKIKLTVHAKERIFERGIKITEIKQAIFNPDYKKHTFDNKTLVRKSFSKEVLEVIYITEEDINLIITSYFL